MVELEQAIVSRRALGFCVDNCNVPTVYALHAGGEPQRRIGLAATSWTGDTE